MQRMQQASASAAQTLTLHTLDCRARPIARRQYTQHSNPQVLRQPTQPHDFSARNTAASGR